MEKCNRRFCNNSCRNEKKGKKGENGGKGEGENIPESFTTGEKRKENAKKGGGEKFCRAEKARNHLGESKARKIKDRMRRRRDTEEGPGPSFQLGRNRSLVR